MSSEVLDARERRRFCKLNDPSVHYVTGIFAVDKMSDKEWLRVERKTWYRAVGPKRAGASPIYVPYEWGV